MCVVVYTDSDSIKGAEISFKHLVADISENMFITVVGICQVVVDEIAHHRLQASRVLLLVEGMRSPNWKKCELSFWVREDNVQHWRNSRLSWGLVIASNYLVG
ncbi:MAG: hypothetical protein PUP92_09910 [Rhizonema sp. PD38]|nr:hypothetical protein [Rhizonema sp. PD38]